MRFIAGCVFSALLATVVATSAHASPNLLVNGGFESGDFSNWSGAGSDNYTYVVSTSNESVYDGSDNFGAQQGSYFLVTGQSGGTGTLSQSFTDVAGGLLTVTGYLAGNAKSASSLSNSDFIVSVDGVAGYSVTLVPDQGYTEFSFTVAATGSDTLSIAFRDDYDFIAIDSLSVTEAVAEPVSLALLTAGLFGLGLIRRRRSA